MPANKDALIRYRAINRCLINRGIASKDDLIDACSEATTHDVSWRTIAEDIRAMRNDLSLGYEAPIENVPNQGYRYSDPDYSIDRIPLNNEELSSLSFAAKLLDQYRDVGIFSTFSGAVQKLSEKLMIRLSGTGDDDKKVVAFETSTADGGGDWIDELLGHIRRKTVVRIGYFSFSSGRQSTHLIHPYFLKEYRNRWYLVGWHEAYSQIRTLALERIDSMEPDYTTSYRDQEFDASAYYKNAIGVSVNDSEPVLAKIRILAREWPYVESQPWHHSLKATDKGEEFVIFTLKVIVNYEFKNLLLSYGNSIEVLEPESLRRTIAAEISSASAKYDDQ